MSEAIIRLSDRFIVAGQTAGGFIPEFKRSICNCYSGRTESSGRRRHVCALRSKPNSPATDCFTEVKITQHWLRLWGPALAYQGLYTLCCVTCYVYLRNDTIRQLSREPINNKKLSCCCDSRSYRVQIRSPHTSAGTLQSALGSVGTRIGACCERHCADARPYKRRYMCIAT